MKQLFERLDVTNETKAELQKAFDSAVLVEATKLARSKEAEYEEYMKVQLEEMKSELEETLDAYLEKVVEQFVQDNTFAIEESIKSEKYEAVLEGFNSLMVAGGVKIAQIAEAVEAEEAEADETAEKLADKLMAENLELKNKNAELLKTGLIKESMENMTPMQKDKFLKLAKFVEFKQNNPVEYIEKIDALVESVTSGNSSALSGLGTLSTRKRGITERSRRAGMMTESVNSVNSKNGKYVSNAKHLF